MSHRTETTSVWTATSASTSYPALAGDKEVDVAVVGGGITGLTAAWALKRAGRRVAVLEAYRVGEGESGQTSAHLTQVLDTRYHVLASRFGAPQVALIARAKQQAIEQLEAFSQGEEGTQFKRVPGFLYAARPGDISGLEKEVAAMKEAGMSASLVHETPLPFQVPAAIRVENQAMFHVRNHLVALARKVNGDGSLVLENTRVTEAKEGAPCELKTATGTVRAQHVVIATSHPTFLPTIHVKLAPYRTYVVAVAAPLPDGLYWDTEDPYHYLRPIDVKGERLVIVGGEDHRNGHVSNTQERMDALKAYAAQKLGTSAQPRFAWSGQVEEPPDGLPLIGADAHKQHFWIATGFAGNGLTWGTVAGKVLANGIEGKVDPLAELLAPGRKLTLAGVAQVMENSGDIMFHEIVDRLRAAGQLKPSLASLKPGEGKTLTIGGHCAGVYRDARGECHAVSAVCTHQKGVVQWNAVERSWDCPCHGGRFSAKGEVLNAPPLKPLESMPLPGEAD